MKRFSAALGMGLFAVVGMASAVSAQSDVYPPRATVVTVDVDTVAPGGTFNVTLFGCFDGELVRFVFETAQASATCDLSPAPRALMSSTDNLGLATASFVAPPVTGKFGGTVRLDNGRRSGGFAITVATEETIVPASLLRTSLDVQMKRSFNPLALIIAAIAAASTVVLRPQLE